MKDVYLVSAYQGAFPQKCKGKVRRMVLTDYDARVSWHCGTLADVSGDVRLRGVLGLARCYRLSNPSLLVCLLVGHFHIGDTVDVLLSEDGKEVVNMLKVSDG